jgi:hypothetical protein
MVVAAARALCSQYAITCNVDKDDAWKVYGSDFLQDAEAALKACGAPELLDALRDLVDTMTGRAGGETAALHNALVALAKAEDRS